MWKHYTKHNTHKEDQATSNCPYNDQQPRKPTFSSITRTCHHDQCLARLPSLKLVTRPQMSRDVKTVELFILRPSELFLFRTDDPVVARPTHPLIHVVIESECFPVLTVLTLTFATCSNISIFIFNDNVFVVAICND